MKISPDKIINSPIEKKIFNKHLVYIKRDDLLSSEFSGNKARKFYYFLKNDFPNVKNIVSYGSSQSNAMYSISVLSKLKGWKFDYYVDHLASYLEEHPHGNFKYALENGMQIHVGEEVPSTVADTVFIEEGGRQEEAEFGLKILADEILFWKEEHGIDELNIFLPAGTGTTALYLQKNIVDDIYTVPCVGDATYLKKQFFMLEDNEKFHPKILASSKKRHFGKLYRESYNIWLKLREEMGIEFDMLYDPHGWLTLLENPEIFRKPMLYIHQGGLIGNESMLTRYRRKYSENI